VAITTPVPRPPCGLSARPRRPLDDALTPPWASADSLPFLSGAPDLSASIRPTCSPTVSPADAHSELGPRSLDPDRPFRERVCRAYSGPDVAYRLLQLHSFRHAGNQTRALVSSQGRRPRPPSFSFLPRSLPCGSGDKRRAVRTPDSLQPRCRFLPLSRVCPTAMLFRTRHPRGVSPMRLSADLRVRVSGPSEGRVPSKRDRSCLSCWLRALV
jgi:hypothetical protein